ncbi:MAG TPA: YdcF family protein [Bryobacteraceae bacterium]|nr:YdcF family protein [Bryobacteraceae bacterium]
MVGRRRLFFIPIALTGGCILPLVLTHSLWMGWMGAMLVSAGPPVRADLIVVLAGDTYGNRILKAAQLVKDGYASRVLVSGAPGFYDLHESDLAIPFAVRRGYPAAWFIPAPHNGHSTDEEARALLPAIEAMQARNVIVVTSDYHTRRAMRTLHREWPGLRIHMVAAADRFFSPRGWWHTREGRKTFFIEWSKTFASAVGL